jgi:hypothetical protein
MSVESFLQLFFIPYSELFTTMVSKVTNKHEVIICSYYLITCFCKIFVKYFDGQAKNIILLGLPCDIINYGTEMIHEISYSNFNNTKPVLTSYLIFTFDILKLWHSQRRVEYVNTITPLNLKLWGCLSAYVRSDNESHTSSIYFFSDFLYAFCILWQLSI